jgi:hypothetical protein
MSLTSLLLFFGLFFADIVLAACDRAKLEEIKVSGTGSTIVDYNLDLTADDIVGIRLILSGNNSSGVTINCQSGTLAGGFSIRSGSYQEAGIRKWVTVENVTINNCQILTVLHTFGMARTANETTCQKFG